jgi:hypothetical protein
MKKPSVMVCLPAYGQTNCTVTTESLFKLAQFFTLNSIRHQLSWYSAADIVEVRNLFLTSWYDCHPQYSHMLFIDADMGFEPELIRDMIDFDKPLTGTFYARRQMPASVVGAALHPDHSFPDIKSGFLPAAYVGGGVMLIKRSMMKEMLEKKPELIDALPSVLAQATSLPLTRLIRAFDTIIEDNRRLSEDISFCSRWIECGGEIWANVMHKIDHVGPFNFHLRYGGIMEKTWNEDQANAQNAA